MTSPVQPRLIDRLRPVISDARLGTYRVAAGFDDERALALYLWNAEVGEAFHLTIQAVEVALRNRTSAALERLFGAEWWASPDLLSVLDGERKADLDLVLKRIRNRKLPLAAGQVVAGLSLGFWVGMLHKRYNPTLWGGRLHQAFPDYPLDRNRASLAEAASRVAWLRNRIWHHEPIIHLDLSLEHARVVRLLRWLSVAKADWIVPHSRLAQLLHNKP
jgi:hypothetical protein